MARDHHHEPGVSARYLGHHQAREEAVFGGAANYANFLHSGCHRAGTAGHGQPERTMRLMQLQRPGFVPDYKSAGTAFRERPEAREWSSKPQVDQWL